MESPILLLFYRRQQGPDRGAWLYSVLTASKAFISPAPWILTSRFGYAFAVFISLFLIWPGVRVGFFCSIWATMPAHMGVAMEVPDRVVYHSSVRVSFLCLSRFDLGERSDTMLTPGASTSGFVRSSLVGPRLEKSATIFSSG